MHYPRGFDDVDFVYVCMRIHQTENTIVLCNLPNPENRKC